MIYKFSKSGELLDTYKNAEEFIVYNKISIQYYYKCLNSRILVHGNYYITDTSDLSRLLLASKSNIKAELNVQNYNILVNYRNNLILILPEYESNLRVQLEIQKEIINLTKTINA